MSNFAVVCENETCVAYLLQNKLIPSEVFMGINDILFARLPVLVRENQDLKLVLIVNGMTDFTTVELRDFLIRFTDAQDMMPELIIYSDVPLPFNVDYTLYHDDLLYGKVQEMYGERPVGKQNKGSVDTQLVNSKNPLLEVLSLLYSEGATKKVIIHDKKSKYSKVSSKEDTALSEKIVSVTLFN